jgi:hypothetical protein
MKLDVGNFWNASVGTWKETDEVPEAFTQFAKSGSSTYYTNKKEDTVIRVSDHWGSGIRECNWYLKGYARNNSFLFSKKYGGFHIGIIKIKDLTDIQNK